jgi:hypothetical protein
MMKKISQEEGKKPFTSSLNIYPEAVARDGGSGVTTPPLTTTANISVKDDVTVILLRGVYFMEEMYKKKV